MKKFRGSLVGLSFVILMCACVFHISLAGFFIIFTLMFFGNIPAWIPWKKLMEQCFVLSMQEVHLLWKSVANSIRGQESYFSPAGHCMSCSHVLYEGAHYCTNCGLATSLLFDGVWCRQCGRISPKGSYYCAYCCFEFSQAGIDTPPAIRTANLHVKTVPHPTIQRQSNLHS